MLRAGLNGLARTRQVPTLLAHWASPCLTPDRCHGHIHYAYDHLILLDHQKYILSIPVIQVHHEVKARD